MMLSTTASEETRKFHQRTVPRRFQFQSRIERLSSPMLLSDKKTIRTTMSTKTSDLAEESRDEVPEARQIRSSQIHRDDRILQSREEYGDDKGDEKNREARRERRRTTRSPFTPKQDIRKGSTEQVLSESHSFKSVPTNLSPEATTTHSKRDVRSYKLSELRKAAMTESPQSQDAISKDTRKTESISPLKKKSFDDMRRVSPSKKREIRKTIAPNEASPSAKDRDETRELPDGLEEKQGTASSKTQGTESLSEMTTTKKRDLKKDAVSRKSEERLFESTEEKEKQAITSPKESGKCLKEKSSPSKQDLASLKRAGMENISEMTTAQKRVLTKAAVSQSEERLSERNEEKEKHATTSSEDKNEKYEQNSPALRDLGEVTATKIPRLHDTKASGELSKGANKDEEDELTINSQYTSITQSIASPSLYSPSSKLRMKSKQKRELRKAMALKAAQTQELQERELLKRPDEQEKELEKAFVDSEHPLKPSPNTQSFTAASAGDNHEKSLSSKRQVSKKATRPESPPFHATHPREQVANESKDEEKEQTKKSIPRTEMASPRRISAEERLNKANGSTKKRDAKKFTVPQPPRFHEIHARKLPKSTEEQEKELIEYYQAHPFKANPILSPKNSATDSKQKRHSPRRQKTTQPKPFHFQSDERAAIHDKTHKGSNHDKEDERQKKRSVPDHKNRSRPVCSPTRLTITKPHPFSFASEKRAREKAASPSAEEKSAQTHPLTMSTREYRRVKQGKPDPPTSADAPNLRNDRRAARRKATMHSSESMIQTAKGQKKKSLHSDNEKHTASLAGSTRRNLAKDRQVRDNLSRNEEDSPQSPSTALVQHLMQKRELLQRRRQQKRTAQLKE